MILEKDALLRHVLNAIKECQWKVISSNYPNHPMTVNVSKGDEMKKLLIYIWNITHGGKTRSKDEYRIQLTGVRTIRSIEDGQTLLLGLYLENEDHIFVSFDPSRHQHFGSSPSLQVRKQYLEKAKNNGLAIQEKIIDKRTRETESVIVFKDSLFMETVLEIMPEYRNKTISTREFEILSKEELISEEDLERELIPDERKKAVRKINAYIRKDKFRRSVMKVYNSKCAFCKIQLNLPEACHILPVSAGGYDTIDNGIALCPNHHKAFDDGLIDIDDSYVIRVNKERLNELSKKSLDGRVDEFLKNTRVGEKIILPSNKDYAPNLNYLRKSRKVRGINFYSY
ncbi:MAG: HNH endonuclease [Candidatus Heimdallarchaeaceae archaeon]